MHPVEKDSKTHHKLTKNSVSFSCQSKQVSRCCMNFLHELTCQILTNQSPHVRESMTVLDYGFHPVDSGFRVLDSGFHPVDSGFRVLDSGFQFSGFRIPKRAGFQFFFCFKAFLRISFSCSNLAILKDVV